MTCARVTSVVVLLALHGALVHEAVTSHAFDAAGVAFEQEFLPDAHAAGPRGHVCAHADDPEARERCGVLAWWSSLPRRALTNELGVTPAEVTLGQEAPARPPLSPLSFAPKASPPGA